MSASLARRSLTARRGRGAWSQVAVRASGARVRPGMDLENSQQLDTVADLVAGAAAPLSAGTARRVLSGAWMGHALHPLLTDLPIGFWTSSFMLDLVGGRHARRASQRLIAMGLLCVPLTAASGASDWGDSSDQRIRRVGLVHAAVNSVATIGYGWSWWSRRRGRHRTGVLLGFLAGAVASVGGHLGGHLVFRLHAGTEPSPAGDSAVDLGHSPVDLGQGGG